ncbi:phosphocholine-specific phospholipase C [Beijerinckia indica]|uniref:phospholipase C n=1 Tax=Beijerinckia indica subsp. indica (strain ATCC 9039 / DSM 1715 / NCIMB 8712) TaxID=395963 RepID=B2IG96_BEII9|nr:phospholipase C, phosphocholine-specific [Beijerinckia indica]ACB97170.1 phospholipase C, phosphocholine-specific [Beijerinckia indica subsp. indica ATCC 9039]
MDQPTRRDFVRLAAGTAALSPLPLSIRKALAIPASVKTGTIKDVKHIVILMQENRSFDHYFGTMRGVRGFGDRFPIPLASGKPVWYESDGTREITPYHLDQNTMNAALIPSTPHSFSNTQAAWNQGKYGFWPVFKNQYSMGYYTRNEIPFQYALAEAFTICDGYHCSVATGTDPNRIAFWSGSNFNPDLRAKGVNSTDADSEPNNLRCWIKGHWPTPGYTYAGSAFKWPTIPEVLEQAGISWRIYQDPNNNWTGAMNGCLAFESFRTAAPGSSIYKNGMSLWSLADLANDVKNGTLPAVSWVLPSQWQSEHPGAPSSPAHGGDFTQQVLEALTSNPAVWSETVFFLTFDENDGLFDHIPAPAVPSYNLDGTLAGKATLDVAGMYFIDDKAQYLDARDTISGNVRPWGHGPRVPMYVVSPWSRGGWVNSQVFCHTSIGQFLEKRFNIEIPAISPWHRSVSGDMTSAFDFVHPNDAAFPALPDMSNYAQIEAKSITLPIANAPATPQPLYQEGGWRYSRALPYELDVRGDIVGNRKLHLSFHNTGQQGAVFHVYDKLHLDRIPRRYTVEAGKTLTDDFWDTLASDAGHYDLWVYGPNGFVRTFKGTAPKLGEKPEPKVFLHYDAKNGGVRIKVARDGFYGAKITLVDHLNPQEQSPLQVPVYGMAEEFRSLARTSNWYDFTVVGDNNFERRFAGRLETGKDSISDPAMATTLG